MMTDTEIGGVLLRLRGRIAEVGVMHCEVGGLMGIDPTAIQCDSPWSAEDAKAFRGSATASRGQVGGRRTSGQRRARQGSQSVGR